MPASTCDKELQASYYSYISSRICLYVYSRGGKMYGTLFPTYMKVILTAKLKLT